MNNPAGLLVFSPNLSSSPLFSFPLHTRTFLSLSASTRSVSFLSALISLLFCHRLVLCVPGRSRSAGLTFTQGSATVKWTTPNKGRQERWREASPTRERKRGDKSEREEIEEGCANVIWEMASVSRSDQALKLSTSPLTALSGMLALSLSLSSHSPTLADTEIPTLSTHPHIAQKRSLRIMKFPLRSFPSLHCGNTQQQQFHNTM